MTATLSDTKTSVASKANVVGTKADQARCVVCGGAAPELLTSYRVTSGRGWLSRLYTQLAGWPALAAALPLKQLHVLLSSPFHGNVVRCATCGLAQLDNMPTDAQVAAFYGSDYWPARGHSLDVEQYKTSARAQAQLAFIANAHPDFAPSSVLEIGAAAATPSIAIRARSKEAVEICVIEPATAWRSYYEKLGVRVVGDTFPTPLGNERFSHVHTSHWLEHAVDPLRAVVAMRELLDDQGTVFVEVPYADDDYWSLPVADFPHALFFSQGSLRSLFALGGFHELASQRVGISVRAWSEGKRPGTSDYSSDNPHGFWIRALYRKTQA